MFRIIKSLFLVRLRSAKEAVCKITRSQLADWLLSEAVVSLHTSIRSRHLATDYNTPPQFWKGGPLQSVNKVWSVQPALERNKCPINGPNTQPILLRMESSNPTMTLSRSTAYPSAGTDQRHNIYTVNVKLTSSRQLESYPRRHPRSTTLSIGGTVFPSSFTRGNSVRNIVRNCDSPYPACHRCSYLTSGKCIVAPQLEILASSPATGAPPHA